jgi:phytanoyl-CoA hydroxylase
MNTNSLQRFATTNDGALTAPMRDAFSRDGVIILDDFVPVEECQRLRSRMLELIDEFDPTSVKSIFSATKKDQMGDRYFEESGDRIRFFFEHDAFDDDGNLVQSKKNSLNKVGHALHDLDPVFDAFSRTSRLAAAAGSLQYDDPVLLQSMYIFKPPRIGGEVHCHQDSTYLYTDPESCVGFWFALEDATVENGCMHFIPGAHKGPLKELQARNSDGEMQYHTLDDTPWPDGVTAPAEAKAGTMVMFDGRAPHLSGANSSDISRHAYTVHVIDRTCRYPAENWLQRSPNLPFRGFE